jgi:ketosteroid isomerase-like protein
MRSVLFMIAALLAVAGVAYAQSPGGMPASSCVADPSAPHDVDSIRKVTLDWVKAYVARDRGWFERNYADEVVINGKPRTREEEIHAIEAVKSFEIPNADFRVMFYGNLAVATGLERITVPNADGEKVYKGRFTNVFAYCSGRWMVVVDDWFALK